jgi:peptide/nickel transport system permease protein
MAPIDAGAAALSTAAPSPVRRFVGWLRGLPPGVLFWGALTLLIVFCLVFAPALAPYDPARQNLLRRFAEPSALHWLGTDHLGRDVLSRLLYGGRFSVSITAITLGLSVVIGVLVGVISARAGGWVDEFLMRLVDLLISFPDVIVALFLIAILGPGYGTLIVALTVHAWTPFARMMRGLALDLNRRDFVKAAEILNCSRRFIVLRHIIPNAIRPITAIALLRFGHKLIVVGGLSFLGLGVQPPMSDWGSMLAESRRYMERAPMLVIAPGVAIFVTALAVTTLGQSLDPGNRRPGGGSRGMLRRRKSRSGGREG